MSKAYTYRDGLLIPINVMCMADDPGRVNLGSGYNPCELTLVGETELKGWGENDGMADIYTTESGSEILIPNRIRERIRKHLAAND